MIAPAVVDCTFNCGKHRGRSFSEVSRYDPSYVSWAMRLESPYGELQKFVQFLHAVRGLQGSGYVQHERTTSVRHMPSGQCSDPCFAMADVPITSSQWWNANSRMSGQPAFHSRRQPLQWPWNRLPKDIMHHSMNMVSANASISTNKAAYLSENASTWAYPGKKICGGTATMQWQTNCSTPNWASSKENVDPQSHPCGVHSNCDVKVTRSQRDDANPGTAMLQDSTHSPAYPCVFNDTCGATLHHSTLDDITMNFADHNPIVDASTTNDVLQEAEHSDCSTHAVLQPHSKADLTNADGSPQREVPARKRRRRVVSQSSESECAKCSHQAQALPAQAAEDEPMQADAPEHCVESVSPEIALTPSVESNVLPETGQAQVIIKAGGKSKAATKHFGKVSGEMKALADMSHKAELALLDHLAGPSVEGPSDLSFQQKCAEVRTSIKCGCTNLRIDHWLSCELPFASSSCFAMLKVHQVVGVRWLLALHSCVPGMVLADEMGLGKTLQVLCFLEVLASQKPSLIIAPASLIDNWVAEVAKWTPKLKAFRYHAKSVLDRLELQKDYFGDPHEYHLVITTPQAAHNKDDWYHFFKRIDFECVVIDEAHCLKNSKTARYRDLLRLKCHRRILLTGTPVQNSLDELATLLEFALSNDHARKEVSAAFKHILASTSDGALRKLQKIAGPFILRRLKSDVLADLPAKRGIVVYCTMESKQKLLYDDELERHRCKAKSSTDKDMGNAFYNLRRICLHPLLGKWYFSDTMLQKFCEQLAKNSHDLHSVSLAHVEREVKRWSDFAKHQVAVQYGLGREFQMTNEDIMGSAKMKELIQILRRQASKGSKTLVFSQFTQLLDITQVALTISEIEFCRLDGKTPIEDRQQLTTKFQSSGGPLVFLVSTKAGGVGLTLTAANAVVMLDLDFNPQNTRQAEDRVHRLGQNHDVVIYYLVCEGTVEELVLNRNLTKMQLDQQFGAQHAVLQLAASEAQNAVDVQQTAHDEDRQRHDDGKVCEEFVYAELRKVLCK